MKGISSSALLALAVLFALLLAACSGAAAPAATSPASQPTTAANVQPTTAPTAAPTDTPQPATAPTTAPTDTPSPTTQSTAAAATPGNLPQDLANAVDKTRNASVLRFEGTFQQTVTKNGQPVTNGGSVSGAGNGADTQTTFSGTNGSTGKTESFEFIQTGGKLYVKGLALMSKMDPNTWYIAPAVASGLTQSVLTPKIMLGGFKSQEATSVNFAATGIDVVDLLPCEVWSAQNPTVARSMSGANTSDSQREFGAIDQFDIKLWTCADGYLHQMKLAISGHDPKLPTDKETINGSFHIYDFGANIQIPAPANAQPLVP